MKHLNVITLLRVLIVALTILTYACSVLNYLDTHEYPVQYLGQDLLQLAALLFVFIITKKKLTTMSPHVQRYIRRSAVTHRRIGVALGICITLLLEWLLVLLNQ